MAYRLLLPAFVDLPAADVSGALADFRTDRLDRHGTQWGVVALAWEPVRGDEPPLQVTLCPPDQIEQEPSDVHWHVPRDVRCWVEVRIGGEAASRQACLRAQLVAMVIANRLQLPVLETRQGVYCRTPEAFVAWCSGEPHRKAVPLARQEHVAEVPPEEQSMVDGIAQPAVSLSGSARKVDAARAQTASSDAPLPPQSWIQRVWRRLRHVEPHVIHLPGHMGPAGVYALVCEMEDTFHRHNVVYEHERHRLIVYSSETHPERDRIGDARDRMLTPWRGRRPLAP